MFTRRQSGGLVIAISMGLFSVGCFTKKNKEVAVTGAAPPPSAYPVGPSSYSNNSQGVPVTEPVPASAIASTNPTPAAPFQLREQEQLVNHPIASGESLSSIAAKYNTSISRIQSANGMTDTKIIAGKSLQVPTSAPPANLAMNAGAALAGAAHAGAAPAGTSYSGTTPAIAPAAGIAAPSYSAPAITVPVAGAYPSAIAPPPVPTAPQVQVPGNAAATSYPREAAIPAPAPPGGAYAVPSFQGSQIPFSQ